MLLRNGVGYPEFSQVCKALYVDEALSNYGRRGRPTNRSRVALMIGITRKEVATIRRRLERADLRGFYRNNVLTDLLNCWHSDPLFVDDRGRPRPLHRDGRSPSFLELSSRIGKDLPPGAVLAELLLSGVAELTPAGMVRPVSREYAPAPLTADATRDLQRQRNT